MVRMYDLTLHSCGYEWDGDYREWLVDTDDEEVFSVCNLSNFPEEAIVTRKLFGAVDYVRVLNEGIRLGREGYTEARIANVF